MFHYDHRRNGTLKLMTDVSGKQSHYDGRRNRPNGPPDQPEVCQRYHTNNAPTAAILHRTHARLVHLCNARAPRLGTLLQKKAVQTIAQTCPVVIGILCACARLHSLVFAQSRVPILQVKRPHIIQTVCCGLCPSRRCPSRHRLCSAFGVCLCRTYLRLSRSCPSLRLR